MTVPTQRAASKTATQQRIVDAAFTLFRQHGYEATTMSQIARQAETSRPNLYLHFASKTQIVLDRMKTIEPSATAMYDELGNSETFTADHMLEWLRSTGKDMWASHSAEFDAINRATATDDEVLDEWLGLHRRISTRLAERLKPELDGDDRAEWETYLTTLLVGLERNFYFIYIRGHAEREEFALRGLARQWAGFLGAQN